MNRCFAFSVLLAFLCTAVVPSRGDDDFVPLFDGQSLDGWVGDERIWSVADGMIVGTTDEVTIRRNTFLATEKAYGNFVLRLQFRLRNGNSGVQVRSELFDDYVVKGYQADIAEQRFMGILYEEGRRGILQDVDPEAVAPHVNQGEWNEYVITVDGNRITQVLNGHTTVDYTEESEDAPREGIIELQLDDGPKMKMWIKDMERKQLP